MRFAYVGAGYPSYLEAFYAARPLLALAPVAEQEQALYSDGFSWNGCWADALLERGYETRDFYLGVTPLDRAWHRENPNASISTDSGAIALLRLRQYRPDVVLYDHNDAQLLRELTTGPDAPIVIGWEGGGLSRQACWPYFDLLLSCAPESVALVRAAGVRAEQMHHAFNPKVLGRLEPAPRENRALFIGQLVREGDFHMRREINLVRICAAGLPFDIHSPSYDYGLRDDLMAIAQMGAYLAYQPVARVPGFGRLLSRLPLGYMGSPGRAFPLLPVNPHLRGNLKPGYFGVDMYACLARSAVCLNFHADTTPDYASNMRLFETTGIGTCLLTDARRNLPDLFEPDREILSFENVDECIEKMRWLLDHPEQARAIASAGQARTLRDHTFARRSEELDQHIRRTQQLRSTAAR